MFQLTTHASIDELPAAQWNALAGDDLPFLRHEFLAAMEHHGGVGERFGWLPRHLALRDADGTLCAVAPAYLKFNSYGEFVFDWAWADAYRRAGRDYYPKLVIASPYTPATGPRILTGTDPRRPALAAALIKGSVQVAERLGVSGLHWLFTTAEETGWLREAGLLPRLGCQFHWTNQGYRDMDDLLASFSAEKRKKVKRERRRVAEAGIRIRRVPGDQVTDDEWAVFHRLYEDTFDKRGGIPTLSLAFFREIGRTMGKNLLLVFAEHHRAEHHGAEHHGGTSDADGPRAAAAPVGGDNTGTDGTELAALGSAAPIVAAAFCLVGAHSLFGRHWGCTRDFHSLHFEACYYQGLEHCIEHGLSRFEPGAQGEHKVARGFLPTHTWSAHWIADPTFRRPIAQFLTHEIEGVEEYITEMTAHSPYRAPPPTPAPVPKTALTGGPPPPRRNVGTPAGPASGSEPGAT